MIDEILRQWRACQFDFRSIAYPADPFQAAFPDWVDYYRLKSAIATVLQPAKILEIGVRYGYSYAAFKDGWPKAHYVGIDLNVDSFGGAGGAIEWARAMGEPAGDEFIVGNTQLMDRLPGDVYDLIHIDGQQDGEGTYHDLSVAVSQGRWLLVDGYFWSRPNCYSVSEFLMRHRDVIECALIIPGHAGEILIKVAPDFLKREQERRSAFGAAPAGGDTSESLRTTYTEAYFLENCGGWEFFRHCGAERLLDERLRTMLDLALAGRPRRLLDLGCGRGEIAFHAARQGVQVTAVDYSPVAIKIAQGAFANADQAQRERVEWVCASAAELSLEGEYDVVVAGDIVEHMAPAELERMYATVSRHLAPGGQFIVHTFPNSWFYRFDYPRRRRIAESVGAFLPKEPRSRYEKLMHINEQSPARMRRQLASHFENVLLWFLNPESPAGSLTRRMTRRELAGCRDLYAIASHQPIDAASLTTCLSMEALAPEEAAKVTLQVLACPEEASANAEFTAKIALRNGSNLPLHSRSPAPVHLSYHWKDETGERTIVGDGVRTMIAPGVACGAELDYDVTVLAPPSAGVFILEFQVVQEGIRWFGQTAAGGTPQVAVRVASPEPAKFFRAAEKPAC
jgi:2-polyprenyl-3-methyl-5-hydroxy-6-metoxy-1,4-benzoquinol methylase